MGYYVAGKVKECDYSSKRYSEPVDGCWALAQGATGRYCVVLHIGPEEIEANNLTVRDLEEVRAEIEAKGAYLDD